MFPKIINSIYEGHSDMDRTKLILRKRKIFKKNELLLVKPSKMHNLLKSNKNI